MCVHLELLISCAEVEGGFPIEIHYIQWVHTWNFQSQVLEAEGVRTPGASNILC